MSLAARVGFCELNEQYRTLARTPELLYVLNLALAAFSRFLDARFISPWARAHAIVSATGNQASVVKLADVLFDLTPLAQLPDELAMRALGKQLFNQDHLGPDDALTPGIDDLLDAFDPARLVGRAAPLPPAYVRIPDEEVMRLPSVSGMSCRSIGIVPTDVRLGVRNEIPADFNPRPQTNPSK